MEASIVDHQHCILTMASEESNRAVILEHGCMKLIAFECLGFHLVDGRIVDTTNGENKMSSVQNPGPRVPSDESTCRGFVLPCLDFSFDMISRGTTW